MLKKSNFRESGIVLIWVALVGVLLIALVGLAADTAYVLWVGHQLQIAADASSLAGALKVRSSATEAREAARAMGEHNWAAGLPVQLDINDSNDAAGDIVIGNYVRTTRSFTPTLNEPNAVKVSARRTTSEHGPVSLVFGHIFDVNTADVSRYAIAASGDMSGFGVIALHPNKPKTMHMQGDAVLLLSRRAIQVNSSHNSAGFFAGSVVVDASDLNVHGGCLFQGSVEFPGDLEEGVRRRPDPLANLPPPVWDPADDWGTVDISTSGIAVDLEPGFYSGGISATGGTINLEPGIYILDGEGMYIRGNASLFAEGVMLYITGTGRVDLAGTGEVYLTPPDRSLYSYPDVKTYEGVTIFQDRSNTNECSILGTALMDINGVLYFPSALTDFGGTGGTFGNALIASMIEVRGNGIVTIDYDDRFSVPAVGSYLVE